MVDLNPNSHFIIQVRWIKSHPFHNYLMLMKWTLDTRNLYFAQYKTEHFKGNLIWESLCLLNVKSCWWWDRIKTFTHPQSSCRCPSAHDLIFILLPPPLHRYLSHATCIVASVSLSSFGLQEQFHNCHCQESPPLLLIVLNVLSDFIS